MKLGLIGCSNHWRSYTSAMQALPVRDGKATPLRPDTVLREGDKVIAIGKNECEARLKEQLIGQPEALAAPPTDAAPAG